MHEVRRELGVGFVATEERVFPDEPGGIEAKFRIAEVLDVPINSVTRFKARVGL